MWRQFGIEKFFEFDSHDDHNADFNIKPEVTMYHVKIDYGSLDLS